MKMNNAIIWNEQTIKEELINHLGNEFREEIENTYKYNTTLGNRGSFEKDGEEYVFIESEEIAEGIAIDQVEEDLEEDPGMFTQSWLQDFIYIYDIDKRIMCNEEEDFIRESVTEDLNIEDFGSEEDYNNAIEEAVKTRLDEYETSLDDPIEYFVDEQGIYSVEDLMKQSWINIDINKASEDAVNMDGWAHFLSRYDGEYETTKNGIVYFKDC